MKREETTPRKDDFAAAQSVQAVSTFPAFSHLQLSLGAVRFFIRLTSVLVLPIAQLFQNRLLWESLEGRRHQQNHAHDSPHPHDGILVDQNIGASAVVRFNWCFLGPILQLIQTGP